VDDQQIIAALIPFVVLIGTFGLVAFWVSRRAKTRELLHRERLAMIEKGLMPPPEIWPVQNAAPSEASLTPRYRSVGVVITALGLGLMLIIGVAAGEGRIGVGIGGAVAVLGLALIINSYIVSGGGSARVADERSSIVEGRTGD
jgi:hypothetical protein